MSAIVVDAALRDRLLAIAGQVEFRDESGQVIGQFTPAIDRVWYEVDGPDVTDEELDQREECDARYTAEQVIDRLRSLRR